MVLNASDYSLPKPGESIVNPKNLSGSATRVVGLVIVLAFLAWAWAFASNRGVPFINSLAGNVGLSSSGGSAWEGW